MPRAAGPAGSVTAATVEGGGGRSNERWPASASFVLMALSCSGPAIRNDSSHRLHHLRSIELSLTRANGTMGFRSRILAPTDASRPKRVLAAPLQRIGTAFPTPCPNGANGMMSFPVPDPCPNWHRVTTCRRGSVGANPATTFPIPCPDGAPHTSPGGKPWESSPWAWWGSWFMGGCVRCRDVLFYDGGWRPSRVGVFRGLGGGRRGGFCNRRFARRRGYWGGPR